MSPWTPHSAIVVDAHMNNRTQGQNSIQGLAAGVGASLIWGTYPLWYKPLAHISTYELLANRITWSLALMIPAIFLIFRKKDAFWRATKDKSVLPVVLTCAAILALWWFTYTFCVTTGRILQAGLGYYLGPIFTVAMGIVFLRERVDAFSAASVLVSFAGIVYYALATQDEFPFFAIALGVFYAGYTVYKRARVRFDNQVSVALELLALLPLALIVFAYQAQDGSLQTFRATTSVDVLLLISLGVINVLPMWWYAVAVRNMAAVPISFVQYISPTCNFLLAVLWFSEPLSVHSMVMFCLVWLGVGIYAARNLYLLKSTRSEILRT